MLGQLLVPQIFSDLSNLNKYLRVIMNTDPGDCWAQIQKLTNRL